MEAPNPPRADEHKPYEPPAIVSREPVREPVIASAARCAASQ